MAPLFQPRQPPSNTANQNSPPRTSAQPAPPYIEITDSDEDVLQVPQPPSNLAAQYSGPQPARSVPSYLELTDSEVEDDRESTRREDELLSDMDGEDASSPEQEEDYMEDFEDEDPSSSTPLPPPTSQVAVATRPLALVPDEVTCGCPDRAIQGRLRVGKCSACSRILHLACRARSSAGQSGWQCYYCAGEALEVLQYDPQDLAYIDEADLLGAGASKAVTSGQPAPPASPDKVVSAKTDEIQCICPSRMSKVRTRLARCLDCGVTAHIACQVRNAAGVPGYTCVLCEGPLENVPDRGVGVGFKRKAVSRPPGVKTKPAPKVAKSTPAVKASKVAKPTQKLKLPAMSQNLSKDVEKELQAAPGEASPRRHNLRQKAVPNMKDRPTRNRRTAKQIEEEMTKQRDNLHTGLVRKSKEPKKTTKSEPRITNLHHIFLRNVPTAVLWGHYCKLPNGIAENAAVREATETDFVNYGVQPINAVPEAWSKELKYRLGLLLDAATSDGQSMHLSAKQWELDVGRALRHLRDMAMEVLHHGSYKGKRARLGLLAEMLGFSEKGTFWKGGEDFAGTH